MVRHICIRCIARDQKRDEHGATFQSSPKINRRTHLHTMKVYNTRPVYSLTIETFNALKRNNSWTDPFRKSSTSFASIFPNFLHKIKYDAVTPDDTSRFLSLYSFHGLRYERPGPQAPFWRAQAKKILCLHFQSLAAKASETKKHELELDLRIRHYHSTKKTNNVNHRNTAYSLKYTEKNCQVNS